MRPISFTLNGKDYSAFGSNDLDSLLSSAALSHPDLERTLFDSMLSEQKALINSASEHDVSKLTDGYPPSEVTTFARQEAEARAFIADATAHTPLIDALALARKKDKSEVAARIIKKADDFAAAIGAIIGKRHRLEDALDALSVDTHTSDDIQSIKWEES